MRGAGQADARIDPVTDHDSDHDHLNPFNKADNATVRDDNHDEQPDDEALICSCDATCPDPDNQLDHDSDSNHESS